MSLLSRLPKLWYNIKRYYTARSKAEWLYLS